MLSNPFHVDIMFFQGIFGKKNPDNGLYGHAFTGIKHSLSALVMFVTRVLVNQGKTKNHFEPLNEGEKSRDFSSHTSW